MRSSWLVQGTAGLEAFRDAQDREVRFGSVICNASGGGLLAGVSLVFEEMSPQTEVFVAEPAGHDDLIRSLAAGERVENEPGVRSIADALMSPSPGVLPFAIHQRVVKGGFAATNEQLLAAMAFAFRNRKRVLEPGGACALAALLNHREHFAARGPVLAILSGGNVDADMFTRALQSG
ncbi:MAG: pyridoxal-phosphate dependent enzyme [Hyphomonadaceae bacterium]